MNFHFISTPITVRYGETDQMGVVHHSNYLRYFEVARLEWLTQLGVSYQAMEEAGVMMPVIEAQINYKTPAKFEDALTIKIHLKEIPLVKMTFLYEVTNQHQEIVCTAKTVLAFMNAENRRPHRCPENFKNVFAAVIK
ncbi:MAG: acyl-CoA thioesterase [Flavobacteriaceae bacterium]